MRSPPPAPQQHLPAGAHQLDEPAALDREVHRLAGALELALLVDHELGVEHDAGERFRHAGRIGRAVDLRAAGDHVGEAQLRALERRRAHVGDVVGDSLERFLLRPEADGADVEGVAHRPACPRLESARPSRSS